MGFAVFLHKFDFFYFLGAYLTKEQKLFCAMRQASKRGDLHRKLTSRIRALFDVVEDDLIVEDLT